MLLRALLLAVLCAALPLSGARAEVVCTAIADGASGKLLIEEGDCDRRVMPASTFKLAISLMGYDSGFLVDEHVPALPFREGYPDWIESWKATTDPAAWIKNSVVWYSQQVTQSLGKERLQRYMADFSYGNEDVSGDPGKDNGLTRSWLSSSLEISPLEQVAFLEKIVKRELPISAHAYDMTSRIASLGALPNGWDVHGKTGSGAPLNADGSQARNRAYGWFVGWATKGERNIVFARLIQNEKREKIAPGPRNRDEFMRQLPSILDSL